MRTAAVMARGRWNWAALLLLLLLLLPLLAAPAAGIVLSKESPLLELNDHLLTGVLSGQGNEVVSPAALFSVIAGAYRAGNAVTRELIQRRLGTDRPGLVTRLIADLAESEPSLKYFFRAYSSAGLLSECSRRRVSAVSKQQLCERLSALLSPPSGRQLNLAGPGAVTEINAEVSAATGGLVSDLFTRLDPDTRLVLAAALGLSAQWLPELTVTEKATEFRRPAGLQSVPGVLAVGSMRFLNASQDGLYGVGVPYNDNALQLEMFFFISVDPGTDAVSLLRRRHYEALAAASPLDTQVVLTFPKFSVKSVKHDYRDVALALGLGPLLEQGLGPNGADKVDQLVHRAVIDVDERGTRAAGAAGISIIPRAGADESLPRVALRLDRPFVASVMYVGHQMPLFTAHVVDPLERGDASGF